ncbi:MAG: arginine deiminase family protein [Gemmatimonadota bacterium]|nr:arginine deiminase family protein [Gemmatimonadota bacterium]
MTDPRHAAYGGPGWVGRPESLESELGSVWAPFSVGAEWTPLTDVLVHRPGPELAIDDEPDAALMLERPDPARAAEQHEAMCEAYRDAGVRVHAVDPPGPASPNQMFAADLMFMTRSGAIVGRPASSVRAGEERAIARRLADLGVPILRSVAGEGTFEGADAAWLDDDTILVGQGLRTNAEGAFQVAGTLAEQEVGSLVIDLPHGSMHLMGELRIVDRDLAFARAGRLAWSALEALRARGYEVRFFPSEEENRAGMAHNFVTLGPRRILMPAGNPASERAYMEAGLEVRTVEVDELVKAAGAIGCLTGVLGREPAD